MAELAAARFAVAAAQREHEEALRRVRSAEVAADYHRNAAGELIDPPQDLNPTQFAEIQQIRRELSAAQGALPAIEQARERTLRTYDEGARRSPLFEPGNAEPVLLAPVRLEAIYSEDRRLLMIRVYPDDVHVDAHEPELTERERAAGVGYWLALRAAGADRRGREAAWRDLVGACGNRAPWVRELLTPRDGDNGEPEFPALATRAEAWTRAARTRLLPDHFEFSAYRDGALLWRHPGEPIPDSLAVGMAPAAEADEDDPEAPGFDPESRWLVDFELAVKRGMGIVVTDPGGEIDLLTAIGVGSQDAATGAERVQEALAAHALSGGLAPLPVGTPTNNTPGSRSGWRSRQSPVDPDEAARRRAAFDPAGDQEAARLARALGVDGATVLAPACDPEGGAETTLRRLQSLQAQIYAWSPALQPLDRQKQGIEAPFAEPWYRAVSKHYARFVRARGPLPPLRIGRQPYGLLPVSATDLWRGEDVDPGVARTVASFYSVFAAAAPRAQQIGEGADQDAVLLDLLSREAAPRWVLELLDYQTLTKAGGPPHPSTFGAVPATSAFAWIRPFPPPRPDDPEGNPSNRIEPFPDELPEAVRAAIAAHPLAELLALFDESLEYMWDKGVPPDPDEFYAEFRRLADPLEQLRSTPTRSFFYRAARTSYEAIGSRIRSGPDLPENVRARVTQARRIRDLLAAQAAFEDEAAADLPRLERLYRETLEPLAHRVDAWVTSLAGARLAAIRERRPHGIRTGAYGWLTGVEAEDPNPSREGYVVTPSLHHATTAAVLRSGWQAHKSDRGAFAVDVQSARVRRALAMVEGVRGGQTVAALLGYQFERGLHEAKLDRFIARFRATYPLAPVVEPEADGAEEARVATGARNVVDGQALRRARKEVGADSAVAMAAGELLTPEVAATLRQILGELDETFDAVADLQLAESVHQLVGGNPARAGAAADAIGRGQELPGEYDVLRTPRGGAGATHHVGILLTDAPPPGWAEGRPLAKLQPGLEAWLRHRLGPASSWAPGLSPAQLDWCALDLLIAPAERVRAVLGAAGEVDPEALERLLGVCERLRAALAGATALTPTHLDPADPAPIERYDLAELDARVGGWLRQVLPLATELLVAKPEQAEALLPRLGELGLPVGRGDGGEVERVRALVREAELPATLPPPPSAAADPAGAAAWMAALLTAAERLLHPAVRVAPTLTAPLPPAPTAQAEPDAVAAWLRDVALVRPRVDQLDGAAVAGEVLAGSGAPAYLVAQPAAGEPPHPGPWIAAAQWPDEAPRPACSLLLQRDGDGGGATCGLLVDSWTEVVPRPPGEHGPEEVVGAAFDFDRPGARAPQSLLIAVPPDPGRGWCQEDLHACVEEALLLAQVRTLDLDDLPELRAMLPILPGGD